MATPFYEAYGSRVVGVAGTLFSFLGLILTAVAPNLGTIVVTYGLIVGNWKFFGRLNVSSDIITGFFCAALLVIFTVDFVPCILKFGLLYYVCTDKYYQLQRVSNPVPGSESTMKYSRVIIKMF